MVEINNKSIYILCFAREKPADLPKVQRGKGQYLNPQQSGDLIIESPHYVL